jgi:hypothetical protein
MKKYFLLFIICFTIFIIHLISIRHGIYGDGNGFYAYTQALFFDKGLNFGPIYHSLGTFQGVKGEFSRFFWDRTINPYPIGTGIIWIPSVALISLFSSDRFSMVFEAGPGLTGILLVMGGLYFLERYLQNFFSKKIASFSVLFFFFASNLFYYSSFEPALSHQPSFFIISFLLYMTYKFDKKFINYFLFGALSGLLFITRVADIILLIPIYWQILKGSPAIKNWATIFISAVVFSSPLFWSYYVMSGNAFHMPYLTEGAGISQFTISITKVMEFLFTARRGLFTWTPIYIFSFIGLVKSRKFLFLLSLTLLILLCSFWASISVEFGQRWIIGGIPYFAFGLASFIKKISVKKIAILFILLFSWNLLTIFHYYTDKPNMIHNNNLTFPMFFRGQFESPIKAFEVIKDKGLNYFFYKKVLY